PHVRLCAHYGIWQLSIDFMRWVGDTAKRADRNHDCDNSEYGLGVGRLVGGHATIGLKTAAQRTRNAGQQQDKAENQEKTQTGSQRPPVVAGFEKRPYGGADQEGSV